MFSPQDTKIVAATCTTDYGQEYNLVVTENGNLNNYECVCKGVGTTTSGKTINDVNCILYYLACPIQAPWYLNLYVFYGLYNGLENMPIEIVSSQYQGHSTIDSSKAFPLFSRKNGFICTVLYFKFFCQYVLIVLRYRFIRDSGNSEKLKTFVSSYVTTIKFTIRIPYSKNSTIDLIQNSWSLFETVERSKWLPKNVNNKLGRFVSKYIK